MAHVGPPTAIILTALEIECVAVVDHLELPMDEMELCGTVYECGYFAGSRGEWRVIVAQTGQGNVSAALHADRAITAFRPHAILLVGVAGGLRDVRRGDVVAADYVYGYEEVRSAIRSTPRIKTAPSSYRLVQRARAVARRGEWIERLPFFYKAPPKAFVGPIAAGEKIVAARRGSTYSLLRKHCGDALAVEKEGHGFLLAMQANIATPAIVVRGVSDLLFDKSAIDDGAWQPTAARHAAAFAFELIDGLPVRASAGGWSR